MADFSLSTNVFQTRYLKVECTQVQDISKNQTTVHWVLSCVGGTSSYYSTGPTTLIINGETVYYKARTDYQSHQFPAARGSVEGDLIVAHDIYGEKTVSISLATAIYYKAVNTVSDTWQLNSIPRAAQIVSAPNFNDEQNPTITYNNYAGNAVTSLQACISFDGTTPIVAYRDVPKTGTSYTFNLTPAEKMEMYRNFGSQTERAAYFILKTVVSGSTYTTRLEKRITLINAESTITATVRDTNTTTIALTGNDNKIIKGYSNATYSLSITAEKMAMPSYVKAQMGSQSAEYSISGTFNAVDSNVLVATMRDSRGLTASTTVTAPTINYFAPTCNLTITSIHTAGYITLTVDGDGFVNSFGLIENSFTVYYRSKEDGGVYSPWIELTNVSLDNNTYSVTETFTGLDYQKRYIFQAKVTDALNTIESVEKTVESVPLFDWGKDDFNFNVPVKYKGTPIVDFVIEEATDNNGWFVRKWHSGKAEAWYKGRAGLSGSYTLTQQAPNIYSNASLLNVDIDFPTGTFVDVPQFYTVDVLASDAYAYSKVTQREDWYLMFSIWSANSNTTTMSINEVLIYCIGEWK